MRLHWGVRRLRDQARMNSVLPWETSLCGTVFISCLFYSKRVSPSDLWPGARRNLPPVSDTVKDTVDAVCLPGDRAVPVGQSGLSDMLTADCRLPGLRLDLWESENLARGDSWPPWLPPMSLSKAVLKCLEDYDTEIQQNPWECIPCLSKHRGSSCTWRWGWQLTKHALAKREVVAAFPVLVGMRLRGQ